MEKDSTNIWIRDNKTVNKAFSTAMKECHGSGMFFPIPNPTFFHPGSRIRICSIPDPGFASKELQYFNPKKWFLSSRKYNPGCSSRIRILTLYPSRIQGSKRHRIPDPDPQHCHSARTTKMEYNKK
jgi:hypothetical protein